MANSPRVNINLVGKGKASFSEDFLRWTFNIGKIIIATTELVALLALGYRFYIDRQIIDLHDQIKREQLFVESQKIKEENYRSIQTRLANVKQTDEATNVKIGIMNNILESVSTGNFTSTNLTIDSTNIKLDGIAFSIFPINSFIDQLKKNPAVTSISLDDIASTTRGIQFKISIELKEIKT